MYRDNCAIKMWKSPYLWVTAVPMLFVGLVTLTGSYQMFGMFMEKAATLATGQAVPSILMRRWWP